VLLGGSAPLLPPPPPPPKEKKGDEAFRGTLAEEASGRAPS
jgi:hypothetical protein